MKLMRWKLLYIFLFIFLIFQTNIVLANNIVVPHEWYRYQGASDSDNKGHDCGPACVAMAIQFIKDTFVPIRDIRNYIGHPNAATSEQLKDSLQHWGISYNHLLTGAQNVIDAINDRNHIVICPVAMLCFSPGLDIDSESDDDPALHYDRYCSFTEELQGHFIIIKGISDDENWIIVYDPGVWGSYPYPKYWYSNGEPKGKERYYKLSEFYNAINSRGIEILPESSTIYVPDNYSAIQAAVDAASSGDTIIVREGTYIENVDVNKDHLTIESESGAGVTIVQAANSDDHVFEVIADYVNINGFTARDAIETDKAGIYLNNANHCNISSNFISNNSYGVLLLYSDNNILTNNIANMNIGTRGIGIHLSYSNNNNLMGNVANFNNHSGIELYYSHTNSLVMNTTNSNTEGQGWAGIFLAYSSENTLTSNVTLGNSGCGIRLDSSCCYNTITENACNSNENHGILLVTYFGYLHGYNILANNTVDSNGYSGITIADYGDNKLTNNIVSFNPRGIWLDNSSNNTIYLNNFKNNSTGNAIQNESVNIWNSPEEITYTYNGATYTNYLGNYWDDYSGTDPDNDGICDSPYSIDGDQDSYPLRMPFENYSSTEDNPPTIEIISPSDGETVSGTVRFSSYATDDYGLEKVEFYIDDELKSTHGPFGPNTVGSTCNWDPDTTPSSITYIPNGNHTFKAKAYDTADQTAVDNISFIVDNIVENQPPVADAGVNQTDNSGQVVWFDGSNSSDPDGTIVSYKWDFGDGGTATGCHANHRFRGATNESKTYTVSLTVEDGSGATATDSCDITVMPLEKTVEITHQPPVPVPGESVFARMTVLYNWIHDDDYVISRIHYESGGFIGVGVISIWDLHSHVVPTPRWTATILFSKEKTYSPVLEEIHYGGDIFQGIEVDAFDAMSVYISGWAGISISIGPSVPAPFFETNSACFQPDYTEAPEVPVEAPNFDLAHLCSPGEMRVYDSEGRVTGLVNGEVKEEIPYSAYNDNTIIILFPVDSYRYEVVGTDEGSYGFGVASVEDGEVIMFTATDIPTTSGAVHQYTINWDALSRGEEGVTVQVDSDGDGKFEDTFTSDDELTQDEFLEETSPPLIGDFGSANSGPPDCIVDFEDLMIFALAYGATPSDPNWNAVCDIASLGGVLIPDGVIDFEDLMIFAMHYGETCADL